MGHKSFIGREQELKQFDDILLKQTASLVVVKGRRRIGKSSLIREFAKDKTFYSFMGLAPNPNTTAQMQRDEFAHQFKNQFGFASPKFDDWSDCFALLASQVKHGRVIILLDEISWLGSKDATFLAKLKNAWDLLFQKNSKLILILCGSVSTWIDKNILSNTAFVGRISWTLTLGELPIYHCSQLMDAVGFKGSAYEKFKILSVTGGVPWYLEQIRKNELADHYVQRSCFTNGGFLFEEFERIFNDLFDKRNKIYRKIVTALVDGPREFGDLCSILSYKKSGRMSDYLKHLVESGFVSRNYGWSLKTGKLGRLSLFRLSDLYIRFYLKYIEPRRAFIEQGTVVDVNSVFANWPSIVGFQFENLVLKNQQLIWQKLKLQSSDIIAASPYLQRKTTHQDGCQIDYLIQTRFNNLYICEIKFSSKELSVDVIDEVKQKITKLKNPKYLSCLPVLIHINGVVDAVLNSNYFIECINFSEFL